MIAIELVFWFSLVFIAYAYFGYPLFLYCLNRLGWGHSSIERFPYWLWLNGETDDKILPKPLVKLIVSASNESLSQLRKKITNTSSLVYPNLEVILAVDNPSSDTMNFMLNEVPTNWKIVRSNVNVGKEFMQAKAVGQNFDENAIYVFTDAATSIEPDAIFRLVSWFRSPSVGMVDGKSEILAPDGSVSSEGLYLRYENSIRRLESQVGSLVTAGGCLFATSADVAKILFDRVAQSDFGSALCAALLGKRSIIDVNAVARFSDVSHTSKEFSRKHRTVLRGMNTLKNYRELLNPFKYGFFSFQLMSHKIAKWLVPLFLIVVYIANIILVWLDGGLFYTMTMYGQIAFYMSTLLQFMFKNNALIKLTSFFVLSNFAILVSLVDFLRGRNMVVWNASSRK